MEDETPLLGGDVTIGVVRVGDTVRRPRSPASDSIAAYLEHLDRSGFDGAPRWRGVDERGRDILDFIDGDVPATPWDRWSGTDAVLRDLSVLLRRLHDASVGFVPPSGACWFGDGLRLDLPDDARVSTPPELITHADVTPQNTVFRHGRPVALIDFDMTQPTTRLADVINTAVHWVPLRHPADRPARYPDDRVLARLTLLTSGYGLADSDRAALAETAVRLARRSWHRMRANAEQLGGGWARMWSEGVGEQIQRRIAWLSENAAAIERAVLDGPAVG